MEKYAVFLALLASSMHCMQMSMQSKCTEKRRILAIEKSSTAWEATAGSSDTSDALENMIDFVHSSVICHDHDDELVTCPKCLSVDTLANMNATESLQSAAYYIYWYAIDQSEFCEHLEEKDQLSMNDVWRGLLTLMTADHHHEEDGHGQGHSEEDGHGQGHSEEDGHGQGHSEEDEDDHGHGEEDEDGHGHSEGDDDGHGHSEEDDDGHGHSEEDDDGHGHSEEDEDSHGHKLDIDAAISRGHVHVTAKMIHSVIHKFAEVLSMDANCSGKSFNDADIINTYVGSHGDIELESFGDVALDLFHRFYSGQCYSESDVEYNFVDYTYSLFDTYANNDCEIGHEELEKMAKVLNIGQEGVHEEEGHDHDGHDHRRKRALNGITSVIDECVSIEDAMAAAGRDTFTVQDFSSIATILLQQTTQGCPLAREAEDHGQHENNKSSLSQAEKYGYGTLAIFIISLLSLLGVLVYPCHKNCIVLSVMLGLAVGSLTGDALLHLIPHGIGLHDHGDHAHDHSEGPLVVEDYVWKMVCVCASVWFFYMLQLWVMALKSCCGSSDDSLYIDDLGQIGHESKDDIGKEKHTDSSIAWMVLIGDAVHNFADGLAVGAAFSVSWHTGLSTSIAVAVHELPHEFGDVAILMQAGWKVPKVIAGQLVSALTAFIGLYVGIAVSVKEGSTEWIFMVAAGMFLYVALGDVIPELHETFKMKKPLGTFIASNIGICIGFVALGLLAVYEERISI